MRNSIRITLAVLVIGAALLMAGAAFARCLDEDCQPVGPDPTRTWLPLWTATPHPTATESATPALESVSAESAAQLPANCQTPPPWENILTAIECWQYWPAPLATPIPYCRLNYTLGQDLACWGYVPSHPLVFPTPPPGGWPTLTPTARPYGYP